VFVGYATAQFAKRLARLERARRQTPAETDAEAEADEAE
jgi:hypothetical protein